MMDNDYTIIDNFLSCELHDEVCIGVRELHNMFDDSDYNGNEFITLGTPERLNSGRMKTMPNLLKKYLNIVLTKDTNLFFQNILYIKHMKDGIPWHVDSQVKDRIQESCTVKYVNMLQNSLPDIDSICVYYPFVPDGLKGGSFLLKTSDDTIKEVEIKSNRMIKIKGTIEHRTDTIANNNNNYRVSMITEQVKLPAVFDTIIKKDGFLYDGTFDDVIIDDETNHYIDWDHAGCYTD